MFLRSSIAQEKRQGTSLLQIVENKRLADGRVVQRHVLYLGEINGSQEVAWHKSIEVSKTGKSKPSTMALFPEDRCEAEIADESIVRVRFPSCGCVGHGSGEHAGWC